MAEHVVAKVGELQPGERKIVTIRGTSVGLFRVGDDYHALRNVCPHQYGPVCTGKVGLAVMADADSGWEPALRHHGDTLACPWHYLEFRISTGQCLAYPEVRLRKYRVVVDGVDIKIVT